ncbi:hypothetical protein HV265_13175 [Citrobacter sp. RHBSTW-00678]|uniref:hypothetical protein n=1 Tax=unclassified Citrobacter TaxID=2644389 RepID=UPI0015EA5B5F|nr:MULTISPECIES: hypothetical protein [unclassified Citrobacter]QLV87862.1 hypothetical protein HV265_13175 [Citrobacter sp. RHBSTW-00678]QMA18021.1 hypothetical protein HV045_10835 [Citrobacter sp. RHBSTW-00053]
MVPKGWSEHTLDDLALVERGKFSVRPRNDPRYYGGDMPFVQTGDVTSSGTYLKSFSQTLNENGIGVREGANKRGNSSRLTQSFHFFMFEPIFSPVNALNQPI